MKSFPFIKQKDTMLCGVAALTMVCRHFGMRYTQNHLAEKCSVTNQGVSFRSIAFAADQIGLQSKSVRVTIENLQMIPLPSILHWNQNHFVVLYGVNKNGTRFKIADPGKGKYTITKEVLATHWISSTMNGQPCGIAMFFEKTDDIQNNTESVETSKSFRVIFKYLKSYRNHFAVIISGLILGCVLQLIMPFLTQWIVDIGISHKDLNFIWLILLGELMIVAGRTVTDFLRRWLLLHISMRVNISLISDFFIKLLKMPMSFFDTKHMGDLMQRMGDHSRVQGFMTGQMLNVVFSFLSFIIFGVVLLIYDLRIFSIFLAGSLCYGIWIASFLKKRKVLDYELFEQQSINQNMTYNFLTSMQEIKLQDCERRRRWEWEDVQADFFTVQMKMLKLQQTQEGGSIFINEVKNILITVFAATAVINGQISIGAMLAIQYIVGQLNSPVEQLIQFIYSLQDVKISLERINEIHLNRDEEDETMQTKEFSESKAIDIYNVDFKYDRHALSNTLTDISFNIPEGKVTAIVGASGSGKTTLIKLMLGYYPVENGEIKIAGNNINKYSLKWWRRHCGVVMQDGVIFSESIERNIAVGDGDVDKEMLEHAARIANIHDYIMALPLKYNTKIGRDGKGLSQGQKQRILIARAVYKNPDFIFLDEATNALDSKNERAIVENLNEFYKGRTVVVVAHRLSTVKTADQIIVLDSGKVVEVGNHTSLIERKGTYYNLVKNQLELGN